MSRQALDRLRDRVERAAAAQRERATLYVVELADGSRLDPAVAGLPPVDVDPHARCAVRHFVSFPGHVLKEHAASEPKANQLRRITPTTSSRDAEV